MPPDIHGEYGFAETFAYREDRILAALEEEEEGARRFAVVLSDHEALDSNALAATPQELVAGVTDALARSDITQTGLAHALAEAGELPMYGMPTRVRNLYTGYEGRRDEPWRTVDRDADLAVFEFAPGAELVKDKRVHRSIGLTGRLGRVMGSEDRLVPMGDPVADEYVIAQCRECLGWNQATEPLERPCGSCNALIRPNDWRQCIDPAGYRTTFPA